MSNIQNILFFGDSKPNPVEVGQRIKAIRLGLGYSMSEFAKKIDSTAKSGTVSNWETGKNLPNIKRLNRIADLGNISLHYLLNGEKTLVDVTEKELNELPLDEFGKIYNETRFVDLKRNFESLLSEDLSDWQLSMLDESLKFILSFKTDDLILSVYHSLLENSRIVLLKKMHDLDLPHQDFIHNSVLLDGDLNYIRNLTDLKK